MKKMLIVLALICANQVFASNPSKSTTNNTVKVGVVAPKTTLDKKAKPTKVDWFMGTNAVNVTTGDTGCGDGGHGGGGWWGWFKKWWR